MRPLSLAAWLGFQCFLDSFIECFNLRTRHTDPGQDPGSTHLSLLHVAINAKLASESANEICYRQSVYQNVLSQLISPSIIHSAIIWQQNKMEWTSNVLLPDLAGLFELLFQYNRNLSANLLYIHHTAITINSFIIIPPCVRHHL